jgi:hypothetical protein
MGEEEGSVKIEVAPTRGTRTALHVQRAPWARLIQAGMLGAGQTACAVAALRIRAINALPDASHAALLAFLWRCVDLVMFVCVCMYVCMYVCVSV